MQKTLFLFLTVLLCTSAYGQEPFLDVLFVSQPGEYPSGLFSHSDPQRHFDANGDGTPDLIITRNNAQGDLDALRAVDVATNEILFEIPDVQGTLSLTSQNVYRFYGFADPDGDDVQDAIFASDQEVVVGAVDMDISEWESGFNLNGGTLDLVGVTDLTGDDAEEVIIYYPDEDVVRIFGGPGNDSQATR